MCSANYLIKKWNVKAIWNNENREKNSIRVILHNPLDKNVFDLAFPKKYFVSLPCVRCPSVQGIAKNLKQEINMATHGATVSKSCGFYCIGSHLS